MVLHGHRVAGARAKGGRVMGVQGVGDGAKARARASETAEGDDGGAAAAATHRMPSGVMPALKSSLRLVRCDMIWARVKVAMSVQSPSTRPFTFTFVLPAAIMADEEEAEEEPS